MCGFTLGLATADVTKDPVVKECVDEPGELVSIAALDKTELWRHTVHGQSHNKEYSVKQELIYQSSTCDDDDRCA